MLRAIAGIVGCIGYHVRVNQCARITASARVIESVVELCEGLSARDSVVYARAHGWSVGGSRPHICKIIERVGLHYSAKTGVGGTKRHRRDHHTLLETGCGCRHAGWLHRSGTIILCDIATVECEHDIGMNRSGAETEHRRCDGGQD